ENVLRVPPRLNGLSGEECVDAREVGVVIRCVIRERRAREACRCEKDERKEQAHYAGRCCITKTCAGLACRHETRIPNSAGAPSRRLHGGSAIPRARGSVA